MPWFMTPYGPQHVIEPGTIEEFERRDYVVMTAQQAADYFAGVAFPDPPSFATEAEVPGIMATVAADAGSAFSVAQRAASVAAVQDAITAGDIVVGSDPALNVVPAAGAAQTLIVGRNLLTLTAATCALTLPTLADGAEVIVRLKQDATGGRAVTWPGTVKWPFDTAPVLQTGANAADEFALVGDGAVWRGVATGAWSS